MSNRDSDFGNFLSGFVIGGLVGAVTAFLLAPQSGEETRTLIKEKGIELKDKAVLTAEETYARAEAAAAEARARADELAKIARDRAEEMKKRGQLVLEEQKSRLEGVIEAAKAPAKKAAPKSKGDETASKA
ncbi:MAG: YtxH domain-containing protein [Anaerolineae bacterium]|nr:YtxH domain-containing protein [Anaerolineae bacterium]